MWTVRPGRTAANPEPNATCRVSEASIWWLHNHASVGELSSGRWWKFNWIEQAHMRVYVNVHNINRHMDLLLNLLSSILALHELLSSTWIIDMVEPNRYHAAGYNQARNHLKYTQSLKGIVPNFEYITFFSCTTKRNIYLCFIYIFKR